jgi:glycosyltransferase involved in cell wall biosynthesis
MAAPSDVWIASSFGRFAARNLATDHDVFVGWSGAVLEAIPVARTRGMSIVIERGSSHIAHQAEVLAREYASLDISATPVDDRMIERELAEYSDADAIMVPTTYAAATFTERGVDPRKIVVNPYGAEGLRFPARTGVGRASPRIRILFVGQVSVRKGIPRLLRAFRLLDDRFELHLVGPVEPALRQLTKNAGDRVIAHGPLRGARLDDRFANADLFCMPSVEEGLPLALLQALAAGLPVVASPQTGAADVIADGREGLVVPSDDAPRLAGALASLHSAERRIAMGQAAKQRIENAFRWRDYGLRALSAYQRLRAGKAPRPDASDAA